MILITAIPRCTSTDPCRTNDAPDSALADFDPDAHPIIAQHFFGVESFRLVGEVAAQVVADLRFRQQVERLHALGLRVTAELLAELGTERSIMSVINQKLRTYASIDPQALQALGGDKFWPAPIREIRS